MKDNRVRRLSRLHRWIFETTRGLIGRRLVNNDMLLLTTIGRRSGKPHTVPLLYIQDGGRYVVIASYGGRPHHPAWYLNLTDEPLVTVQTPRETLVARAVTAGPEDRARLWPRIVEAYTGYATYQTRTERQIPVVFLDPETSDPPAR